MNILLSHWEILVMFFFVALLYSSVGFGGGSSYLAILALFGLEFKFLRAAALLCNITVVSNGCLQFYKKGFLKLKKVLPLVIISIPLAYLGGKIPLTEKVFFIILAFTLISAAVLIWFQPKLKSIEVLKSDEKTPLWLNLSIGGLIGFISGMVGIGGGIFLSPILYLLNWDKSKVISATASFFILVNSISGLLGQFQGNTFTMDWGFALSLVLVVSIGGFIGTYLGTVKLDESKVRKATAVLIAYVGLNLLQKYLFS